MVLRKQNKILNEFVGQQQIRGLDYPLLAQASRF